MQPPRRPYQHGPRKYVTCPDPCKDVAAGDDVDVAPPLTCSDYDRPRKLPGQHHHADLPTYVAIMPILVAASK